MTTLPQDEPQPFTLVGGPLNGELVIVSRCEHGDWPSLAHPHGRYDLQDGTHLYKWTADDES